MSTGTVWRGHGFMAREYHWPRFIKEMDTEECQPAAAAIEECVKETWEISAQAEPILVGVKSLISPDYSCQEDFQLLNEPPILVG